jgi:hypothetical protein
MRLVPYPRSLLLASLLAAFLLAAHAASAMADDATSTALAASSPSSVWGEPVTLTATVTDDAPSPTPLTGKVQFTAGTQDLGSVPVDDHGQASLNTALIEVGTDTALVASFSGSGFVASQGQVTHTVGPGRVSVSETVAPNPTVAGQDATFVATVTALAPSVVTPTGTVQFSDDDGTPILGPQPLSGGKASITVPAGAGSYLVHADYDGGTHFIGNSTTIPQTVNKAGTATTLTSSANPVGLGQNFVVTARVAVNPPGDVPTFGSLQLTANGSPLGAPIPLNGAVGVRVTLGAPSVPMSVTLGAIYSGDDNTNPSSASLPITIGTPPNPGGGGGGASGGGAAISAQQLRALGSTLMRALRARGFAALSGTAEPFTAAAPGVLDQKVYSPKAPASASKAKKPVVLAAARHTFSRAGAGVLKLRLTAAGKRAIRRAKRLKIAIVTRFTPKSGKAVSVVQRLTVKASKSRKAAALGAGWSVRATSPIARASRLGQAHGRL